MHDAPAWPQPRTGSYVLVARFADFYQDVAALRRAQAEGRMAAHLAGDGGALPTTGAEFAARAAARLRALLQQQARRCTETPGTEDSRLEQQALYLMTALADEILIFELDWAGHDAWLDVLLEQAMFGTGNAGSRFFAMAEALVEASLPTPRHVDLAAVFLLAMELGFRGRYRARQAQPHLDRIRERLFQRVSAAGASPDDDGPAFAQAYAYPLTGSRDERLAPVSPWRNLGLYGLAAFLVLGVVTWLVLMHPFERFLNS
ncbi:DotU family type IV/VI secretion system protein [Burkholderia sp. 22PA0099]|uniref:DotU family type IV/VI secretion system protein n=1 Tax=Burkholderia sp. 22PA0099 TaxID=3237372 RepID=UPI0039C19549